MSTILDLTVVAGARKGNGMRAAELIMRGRSRMVVCVRDVVEVLTVLDQTAAAARGTA